MLTLKKRHRRRFLAMLFLILIGLSFVAPVSDEICSKNEYTNEKECSRHHLVTVTFWQLAKGLDSASVAVTALATILLAVITWRLVLAGREQSATTRSQLRAYLSVVVGGAIYQETAKNLRFEAVPWILNVRGRRCRVYLH